MSQPQFQPQPGQPPQQPQGPPQPPQYNPYAGPPGVPQQQPGPAGPPPMPPQAPAQAPGQPPMQPPAQGPGQPPVPPPGPPGWPGPQQQGMPQPGGVPPFPVQPGAQQPRSGNVAGGVFLALLVSFLISLLYAGGRAVAYEAITTTAVAVTVWMVATVINAAAVGLVAGKVGGARPGARGGAVVVGVLGAFFSSTNSIVALSIAGLGWSQFVWMWKQDPFFPAVSWSSGDLWWLSPLSLVVAGGLAFVLAYAVGKQPKR